MNLTARILILLAGGVSLLAAPLRPADVSAIDIWPEGVPGLRPDAGAEVVENDRVSNVHHPVLLAHPAPTGTANGTAVIVCPGGGYARLAIDHEGAAPAQWLNSLGVSAWILKYRMKEYGQPAPLRDVLRAVRWVRAHAAEYGVRPDRIGVMGFSAGGHVAASAGTLFDAPEGRTGAALDAVSARPDFLILLYPVITMTDPYVHAGSRQNLLGPAPTRTLIDRWSTEKQVTKETPPSFLVATTADRTVPVENSLMFYQALRRAGVPGAELHVYEQGPHGFGLRPGHGPTSEWPRLCEQWLRIHGWLTRPGS